MIAERDGEVVGAALTLPDINQVLAKMNGRLLPFGWWRFLTGSGARSTGCGCSRSASSPRYQHLGVAAALYVRHIEVAARVRQKWGEMGWILEVNEPMNRAMEGMGGKVTKRYGSTSCRCRPPSTGAPQTARSRGRLRRGPPIDWPPMPEEVVLEAQAVEEPRRGRRRGAGGAQPAPGAVAPHGRRGLARRGEDRGDRRRRRPRRRRRHGRRGARRALGAACRGASARGGCFGGARSRRASSPAARSWSTSTSSAPVAHAPGRAARARRRLPRGRGAPAVAVPPAGGAAGATP